MWELIYIIRTLASFFYSRAATTGSHNRDGGSKQQLLKTVKSRGPRQQARRSSPSPLVFLISFYTFCAAPSTFIQQSNLGHICCSDAISFSTHKKRSMEHYVTVERPTVNISLLSFDLSRENMKESGADLGFSSNEVIVQ